MTNLRSLPPGVIEKFGENGDWNTADYFATEFYYPTHQEAALTRTDIFAYPVVEVAPGGHIIIGVYPAQPR